MKMATDNLSTLRALIGGIDYAMLTTRSRHGVLVSRPLQTLQQDSIGDLWFFTSAFSGKVEEVRIDSNVNLVYANPTRKFFLSISGQAEILVDRQKIVELWTASQTIFFPGGCEDPTLALLKVTPVTAHYWDGNESPLGLLLKFGKALMQGESSDIGESALIDLRHQ